MAILVAVVEIFGNLLENNPTTLAVLLVGWTRMLTKRQNRESPSQIKCMGPHSHRYFALVRERGCVGDAFDVITDSCAPCPHPSSSPRVSGLCIVADSNGELGERVGSVWKKGYLLDFFEGTSSGH